MWLDLVKPSGYTVTRWTSQDNRNLAETTTIWLKETSRFTEALKKDTAYWKQLNQFQKIDIHGNAGIFFHTLWIYMMIKSILTDFLTRNTQNITI